MVTWHVIARQDLLLLLEAQLVHFHAPKSHFQRRYWVRQQYANVQHRQAPTCFCKRLRRWRERNGDDGVNVESDEFQQENPAGRTKWNLSACRVLRSFDPRLERFMVQIIVNYRTKYILHVVVYYFDTRNHGRN